jgi:hypothetical protein
MRSMVEGRPSVTPSPAARQLPMSCGHGEEKVTAYHHAASAIAS